MGEQGPIAKSVFDIPLDKVKNVILLGDYCEEYLLHPDSSIREAIIDSAIEVGVLKKNVNLNE